ncbi:hypothetical protein Nepgr_029748 [Nepenthes gracilis]|uniref:Uncharacterized protein n=1 Tax=Nepenthes gracilis TaxID=150966 RepID=A0AAD3TD64_NEPGR|nr:hypothetical protein Nepgr_029748 [Nepenthes gracilis]
MLMAECATFSPPNFMLLHCPKSSLKDIRFKPQNSFAKFVRRNCRDAPFSLWNIRKHSTPFVSVVNILSPLRDSSLTCSCLGTLIDSESAAASDWLPVIDQVLLLASIFLTYMAGVIPSGKSYTSPQSGIPRDRLFLDNPTIFGSMTDRDDPIRRNCAWDVVREKLRDSLQVIEHGHVMEEDGNEFQRHHLGLPLSLYAVSDGPRTRLLWSSLEQLEKEVNQHADSSKIANRAEWLTIFCTVIQKACQPACVSWIEKEFVLKNCRPERAVILHMSEKVQGDDGILQYLRKSGKVDLYADLLYFLRYGPLREYCHYDYNLYNLHGISILEDLVITLADGIANIYLQLLSVDGDISDKMPNLGFALCTLSTRALQKLRNEVAMRQWFYENVAEVVSMYEDRFDLCTLQSHLVQEPVQSRTENLSWWKKLSLKRCAITQSQRCYYVVSLFSLTVKRTKELRALAGWKYYFSLLLELSDILMPLVKAIVAQFSNAISFFLDVSDSQSPGESKYPLPFVVLCSFSYRCNLLGREPHICPDLYPGRRGRLPSISSCSVVAPIQRRKEAKFMQIMGKADCNSIGIRVLSEVLLENTRVLRNQSQMVAIKMQVIRFHLLRMRLNLSQDLRGEECIPGSYCRPSLVFIFAKLMGSLLEYEDWFIVGCKHGNDRWEKAFFSYFMRRLFFMMSQRKALCLSGNFELPDFRLARTNVAPEGKILTWGQASGGKCGHGIKRDFSQPHLIKFLAVSTDDFVSCGEYHTCAVPTSGDLFTWGDDIHNARLIIECKFMAIPLHFCCLLWRPFMERIVKRTPSVTFMNAAYVLGNMWIPYLQDASLDAGENWLSFRTEKLSIHRIFGSEQYGL